jgi:hypothetical protein
MSAPDLPGHPFTFAMARDLGLDRTTLFRLVCAGSLRHPVRGVYVASSIPDSIELRCETLRLVLPDDAFVCDRSAAWLHVGDRALAPNEHLEVPEISCFRPSAGGRLRNKLVTSGEREILPRDLTTIGSLSVTTPLRTALDLGRLQPTADLKLHGMDSMLSIGSFSLDELLAEVPRFNRRRGIVELRVLAPLADGGSESFGESALRLRWHGAGLARPQTQISVDVHGREVFRLDMGLEELLFAAEYDGVEWHSDAQSEHDTERRRWLADERSWDIEVFTRVNVFGLQRDAERRLRTAYDAARARRGLPRRFFI